MCLLCILAKDSSHGDHFTLLISYCSHFSRLLDNVGSKLISGCMCLLYNSGATIGQMRWTRSFGPAFICSWKRLLPLELQLRNTLTSLFTNSLPTDWPISRDLYQGVVTPVAASDRNVAVSKNDVIQVSRGGGTSGHLVEKNFSILTATLSVKTTVLRGGSRD